MANSPKKMTNKSLAYFLAIRVDIVPIKTEHLRFHDNHNIFSVAILSF